MSNLFLISHVILWVLVLGMGFLLLGTLRSLGLLNWRLDELEATRPARLDRDGLQPGTRAPEFRLSDIDGAEHALADFAGRKRLLVFVQPGCGPCHDVVPELNRLHRAGQIQVIGINNANGNGARTWAEEVAAEFPVLIQQRWEVSKKYKMFATPFGFLLDEDGVITSRGIVGSPQYLRYVINGAGNRPKAHHEEPTRDASSVEASNNSRSSLKEVSHV